MTNDPTLPPPHVLEAKARSGQLERLPDDDGSAHRLQQLSPYRRPPCQARARRQSAASEHVILPAPCVAGLLSPMSERSVAKMPNSCPRLMSVIAKQQLRANSRRRRRSPVLPRGLVALMAGSPPTRL
jgi:hypothetical protein